MQWQVARYIGIAAEVGHPLPDKASILDFGCGDGETVTAILDAGFDAWGCDIVLDHPSPRLRQIEEPYRLPFDDATFDLVVSEQVLEHVQDLDAAFREIRRVLRPGGFSLHFYPPKWIPVEPHTFVPLATVIQTRRWLKMWARLGIRNQFQQGLSAEETASRNHAYLLAHTNYPSRAAMAGIAARHFSRVRYIEAEHLRARAGRFPAALARPYSGLRSRVLLAG